MKTKHNYGATQSAIALFAGFVGNKAPAGKVVDRFKTRLGEGIGCDGIYYDLGRVGYWLHELYMAVPREMPHIEHMGVFDYDVSEVVGDEIRKLGRAEKTWPSDPDIKAIIVQVMRGYYGYCDEADRQRIAGIVQVTLESV